MPNSLACYNWCTRPGLKIKLLERTGVRTKSDSRVEGVMNKHPGLSEGWVEAEDGKLNLEMSSDATEAELLLHRKSANVRGPPGADVRDVPGALGTQREDGSPMEPLHGARPKRHGTGRPSGVREEPRGLEAEATGGKVDQDMEELRRYLDSLPPETPIRDVVDRCRGGGGGHQAEVYVGSDGGIVSTAVSGCGYSGSGPSSGSGTSGGGTVIAASGNGNTDSTACSGIGV